MANITSDTQAKVSLVFDSNAKIIKNDIEQLTASLNKLSKEAIKGIGNNPDFGAQYREGAQAAAQLSVALKNAINVDTQKLDLSKFIGQLQRGNVDLEQQLVALKSLGPAGQQAFLEISNQIAKAELPLRKTGALMEKLAKTFANVITWKFSTGIVTGFTRSIQQATSYAQSLDKSLNNIRIVTGLGTAEMAKFAAQANEAAKALSTTTTAYTNAALIYYQQGIRDESEIAARTETTIKMANVTRETSTQISQDLTAIWNNFYDGSKSLEYYADVLTALGATTASSTSEIATGLEKFAAIANTVGLSYEYAAAGLATVTAQTRQSADIVGTAFKTLFARMESLKLGDTLDDGVTLGKYSQALEKVGVQILDASGNLRAMDDILDDTGERWGELTRAQQVALAQTVAGMRQYSQFIALMDNWDKMQENLVTAKSSSGTLEEQAEIYAESWEGSKKRVKASLEEIYDTLINSQFFIKFNNLLATILSKVNLLVETLGGLPGLLFTIGAIASRNLQPQLASFFNRQIENTALGTGVRAIQNQYIRSAAINAAGETDTAVGRITKNNLDLTTALNKISDKITEEQRQQLETLININSEYAKSVALDEEELRLLAEKKDLLQEQFKGNTIDEQNKRRQMLDALVEDNVSKHDESNNYIRKVGALYESGWENSKDNISMTKIKKSAGMFKKDSQTAQDIQAMSEAWDKYSSVKGSVGGFTSNLNKERFEKLANQETLSPEETEELRKELKEKGLNLDQLKADMDTYFKKYRELWNKLANIDNVVGDIDTKSHDYQKAKTDFVENYDTNDNYKKAVWKKGLKINDAERQYIDSSVREREVKEKVDNTENEAGEDAESLLNLMRKMEESPIEDLGVAMGQITAGAMSAGMAISSMIGMVRTLDNDSIGPWEKFAAILTTSGMVISSLTSSLKGLTAVQTLVNKLKEEDTIITIAAILLGKERIALEEIQDAEHLKEIVLTKLELTETEHLNAALILKNALLKSSILTYAQVAVVIAAVVAVLILIYEARHKELRQLQQLQENYEHLNKAYEENKNQLEQLESSIKAYEEALKALNDSVEGTKAWNDALENVNDTVEDIINKYPDLVKYLTITNKNGQLSVTGLDDALKAQQNQTNLSQLALLNAGKQVSAQKIRVEQEAVKNASLLRTGGGLEFLDSESLNTLATLLKESELTGNKDKLNDFITGELGNVAEGFTSSLTYCKDGLLTLADTIESSSKEISNYDALIAGLLSKYGYSDAQIKEAEGILNDTNAYDNKYKEFFNFASGKGTFAYDADGNPIYTGGISRFASANSQEVKDLMKQVKELTGIEIDLTNKNAVRGSGANRSYYDTEGKEWKASQLAQLMASAWLQDEIEKTLGKPAGESNLDANGNPRINIGNSSTNAQSKVLSDIFKQALNIGDTITEENMEKLKAAGVDIDSYFTKMSDGTYALTKDAEVFNSVVEHLLSSQYIDNALLTKRTYAEIRSESEEDRARSLVNLEGFDTSNLPTASWSGIVDKVNSGEEFNLTTEELMTLSLAMEQLNLQMSETERLAFTQATSLDELHHIASQLGDYYQINYSEALINLASQYDNCANEIRDYQEALQGGNEVTIAAAQEELELSVTVGEAAKKYDLVAEEIEVQAELLSDNAENANMSKQQLAQLAIANQRLNKGVKTLNDNWEDWNEILTDSNKDSKDYASTIVKLRKAVADLTNESDEANITTEFLQDNFDNISKAAKGDAKAIDILNSSLAKLKVKDLNTKALNDLKLSDNDFKNLQQTEKLNDVFNTVNSGIDSIMDHWQDLQNGMAIEDILNVDDWVSALNEMALATGMSAEQMHSLLSQIGVQADVEVISQPTTVKVPRYRTETSIVQQGDPETGDGRIVDTKTWQVGTDEEEGVIDVAQINTDGSNNKPTINYAPASKRSSGGISKSSTGGGKSKGGGSEKKLKKLDDELDRYHYIREEIEDLQTAYERANKEKDRLFGGDRVKAINSEIAATDKLIDAQDRYLAEIESYRKGDVDKLMSGVLSYTGISPILDAAGRISNYDEIMAAAVKAYNKDNSDKADEDYEDFKKLITKYEESINLFESETEKKADLLRQKQDLYFEQMNYVLELKVKVNEHDLQRIETSIKLLGDSVYKAAERLDLLWDKTGATKDKFDNLNDAVNIQERQFYWLEDRLAKGKISQEQYMEGLEGVRDALQDNLETLIDYDEEMRTYYSTTLSAASAEMDFWTKQLEHSTSVLEHYQKVIQLSGNAENYNMMSVLLKGQVSTRRNSYEASSRWLEELKKERADVQQELTEAQHVLNMQVKGTDAYEKAKDKVIWLEDKIQSIAETTADAEEKMLSDFESYLEALNADLENDINKINYNAEMLASNGLGFDYINSDLNKLKTIQDEYLTKTNQVYETTKFLRQINQDMDKTDNVAQKEKLKNFAKMVEGLKEQGQLSQVELEIAKRRYEVELAQMALEDAKNAKSIVRLSRDNEGNYGYVYSADPDKANDAEQALMDKQNDLYNYVLDTYNNNQQKLQELYKSQQDELSQLAEDYYKNGLMSEEEYNDKRKEIIQRYHDEAFIYIQNIDEARNVLNEVALTDYTEAYASHYDSIIQTIDDWDAHTQENFDEVDDRYIQWKDIVDKEVRPIVGNTLKELKIKTKDVKDESDRLSQVINDEVIPSLSDEVGNINDVTEAYANQRDTILELIEAMQQLVGEVDDKYEAGAVAAEADSGNFSKTRDYGYITESYLAHGGTVNDSIYRQLMLQTGSKIKWLESQGKDKSYYGYTVEERTARYKAMNREDYKARYTEEELKKIFDELGIVGYSSGGYTGDWADSSGRLAVLHRKELVLDEEDTNNILKTVDFVRSIAEMIDLQAVSAAVGMGYLSTPTIGSTETALDQNVHIEANFPSVTDHNEIEQALTTLVNRAAQFANRK